MTARLRILVTGATGKTGSALVRQLAPDPQIQVRAMVRSIDHRSEALRSLGVEVVVGNLDDIRDVRAAMHDVQRAYFVAGFSTNSLDHALNVAVAASEARLEHVVALGQWLSSASHPSTATRRTWLTDQLMSWIPNVECTVINVGWFADNTMPLLGVASQLGVFPFPLGTGKNAPVSNEDIARVAAAVLLDPARYAGRTLRPTGPELLSPPQIAQIYGDVLGRKVRYENISQRMFSKSLRALNLVPELLQTQLHIYTQEYRDGTFARGGVSDVVPEVTGRAAEDFATITRRYAMADAMVARSFRNKVRAVGQLLKIAVTRPLDVARTEKQFGWPVLGAPVVCQDDTAWRQAHASAEGETTPLRPVGHTA